MSQYGEKRDYPKIDLFVGRDYHGTTTWAKNTKVAREKLATKLGIGLTEISAVYQEKRR